MKMGELQGSDPYRPPEQNLQLWLLKMPAYSRQDLAKKLSSKAHCHLGLRKWETNSRVEIGSLSQHQFWFVKDYANCQVAQHSGSGTIDSKLVWGFSTSYSN